MNIKKCPFCGVLPEVIYLRGKHGEGTGDYVIACKNYKCDIVCEVMNRSKELAIEKWNTRP